jgi:hypothetical protein
MLLSVLLCSWSMSGGYCLYLEYKYEMRNICSVAGEGLERVTLCMILLQWPWEYLTKQLLVFWLLSVPEALKPGYAYELPIGSVKNTDFWELSLLSVYFLWRGVLEFAYGSVPSAAGFAGPGTAFSKALI